MQFLQMKDFAAEPRHMIIFKRQPRFHDRFFFLFFLNGRQLKKKLDKAQLQI